MRKVFDEHGNIPENILSDNQLFQDFKLQFAKQENGEPHPLNNKKYHTLDASQKSSFDLMPIRCMSIRQNKPDDTGSIYEIFSRLNTGGLNLSPQEIRGCIYSSDFFEMLYKLNTDLKWRKLIGKDEEDDKFRDVEILLRSFALLYDHQLYTGSMMQFLNRFSKKAQKFSEDEILKDEKLFHSFLNVCAPIDTRFFLSQTGSFNISLFDAVFVTIAEKILVNGVENAAVSQQSFESLKEDVGFKNAITHSTSHVESVKARLQLARKYFYGE